MPREIKEKNIGWKIISYIVMILFTILTVSPLIWLFYSSFKPHFEIIHHIFALPKSLYIKNYTQAWKLADLGTLMMNSIIYSTTATILTTFFALAAGYGFAKFGYKISSLFYYFFILGLLITVHSVLVPLFVMETRLKFANTRIGVILPYIAFGLPFLVYLATSFIRGIPDSMEEAAIIDGAHYLRIFKDIILPMSTPVAATMLIFAFISNWNELIFVLTLTSKESLRSLPVGVLAFAGGRTRNYGLQFAVLVIATLPMIIFYIFFHRQIIKGFAAGAIKG